MRVTIEPYNPIWPDLFLKEKVIIEKALGPTAAIEHIGSTAVQGLAAKPIVDMLVGLPNTDALDKCVQPMLAAGYTYVKKYEPLWPTRRFFMRLRATETVPPAIIDVQDGYLIGEDFISLTHIHIIVKDTYDWVRHIAFREFMRAHPHIRAEYATLKMQLSTQAFRDGLAYNDAKNIFVKKTEAQALQWYRQSLDGNF